MLRVLLRCGVSGYFLAVIMLSSPYPSLSLSLVVRYAEAGVTHSLGRSGQLAVAPVALPCSRCCRHYKLYQHRLYSSFASAPHTGTFTSSVTVSVSANTQISVSGKFRTLAIRYHPRGATVCHRRLTLTSGHFASGDFHSRTKFRYIPRQSRARFTSMPSGASSYGVNLSSCSVVR